jgi:hypothetical protein
MTTDALPIEINRPLNEAEKLLLCRLAIDVVHTQIDADEQAIADALDEAAGRGEVVLKASPLLAGLFLNGEGLVFASREWLAFACMWSDSTSEHEE